MNPKELTQFLNAQIPSSKSLGMEVLEATPQKVVIRGPLDLNRNHFNSAFGGSLGTFLILSCYSWLFVLLEEKDKKFHILLKEATTQYLKPVQEDITAICIRPDEASIKKFLLNYGKKGISRIQLKAHVETQSTKKACTLEGVFVATKHPL